MKSNCLLRTDKELADVYQRNVDTIYRLCYLYLKNHSDAEDAVQTTFMKWLNTDKTFTGHEHEKAWLIVTAKNHCKDILKSWWKYRRVSMDPFPEKSYWEQHENAGEVLEKLLLLPPKYKEVLYLYYYEEYSIKEISKLLERNESTIQSQLSSGRKRLKMTIGGMYRGLSH
ncbi:RNA polymerase sigma factor [Paenibacillus tarimensis]